MSKVKRVGIRALKANLSKHIKEVRAGGRILVLDRDEVVAELKGADDKTSQTIIDLWVASGEVLPARPRVGPRSPKRKVKVPSALIEQLLTAERGE